MIHFPESHPRGSMKAQAFDSLQHVGSSHDRHFLSYPCQRILTGLQTVERFSVNPVSFRILRNTCLAWDRRLPLTSTLLPGRDPSGGDSRVSTWLCRRRPWRAACTPRTGTTWQLKKATTGLLTPSWWSSSCCRHESEHRVLLQSRLPVTEAHGPARSELRPVLQARLHEARRLQPHTLWLAVGHVFEISPRPAS